MVPMPMVCPMLACDLIGLEHQFSRGYEEGAQIFYISMCDEEGQSIVFTPAMKKERSLLWNAMNDEFNSMLMAQPVVKHLVDQISFGDGNQRRIS